MLAVLISVALVGMGCGAKLPASSSPVAQYKEVSSCSEDYGLQAYPSPVSCHEFYKCENGSLSYETCENGLLFDGKGGAVHNHCNYHWAVDCEGRQAEVEAIARGVCEYAYGLFSNGECETHFTKCEAGEPLSEPCLAGLAYDERTHACNWPDLMEYCVPEKIVGFTCPDYLDRHDLASRFEPFPRFATDDCGKYITCVENKPRLVSCGDYTVFNADTLSCDDPELVPKCANYFKK